MLACIFSCCWVFRAFWSLGKINPCAVFVDRSLLATIEIFWSEHYAAKGFFLYFCFFPSRPYALSSTHRSFLDFFSVAPCPMSRRLRAIIFSCFDILKRQRINTGLGFAFSRWSASLFKGNRQRKSSRTDTTRKNSHIVKLQFSLTLVTYFSGFVVSCTRLRPKKCMIRWHSKH